MLNLLSDPWLPVVRRRTGRSIVRPSQITEYHRDDPVIAIDWPGPDFCIATMELLIGLLATAAPPRERRDWRDWWYNSPPPDTLDQAFAPFAHAFALDGPGPRFLQDLEELQSDAEPIERLLIEAPGEATNSKNTDLLVHRGLVASLGRAAAAITLYTFQSWAPAGGAGNRTGLRGGGPLVTMVVPGVTPTLWHTLWANVPVGGEWPEPDDLPLVFPWLAPTVVSDGPKVVTPESSHPLQCWWGMPRRIRLDFTASETPRPCDITGDLDTVHVATWRQRPRGANYAAWGRQHPLTPYYQQKPASEFLAMHPQPGGIRYRHWLGLVLGTKDGLRIPASAVSDWHDRGLDVRIRKARLSVAGYDMDNMKARGFVEGEMPLLAVPDEACQRRLDDLAHALIESADQVSSLLRSAVRNALFSAGATVKADATLLDTLRERLWEETEICFFSALNDAAENPSVEQDVWRKDWMDLLRRTVLALFDEAAPLAANSGDTAAARIGKARRLLGITLAGYGPIGQALFVMLGLPAVATNELKRKRKGS